MSTESSINELITLALSLDSEEEPYWDTVWALRRKVERETFEAARDLCKSELLHYRALGVNILAQLGAGIADPLPFLEESLPLLISMLDDPVNQGPELRDTLIAALGHQHDVRAVHSIVRFKTHPDSETRYGVAVALGGLEDETAIASLVELSADEDSDVRDWATFGLGTGCETDTPEIREALIQRLTDSDDKTRAEAINGLALRGDERVIASIILELETGNPGSLIIEAAGELAHPSLLPSLLQLKAIDDEEDLVDEDLAEAIEKCRLRNL